MKEGDAYWALPTAVRSLALFYNERLLDEAGVEPLTTLEEMVAAARAMTKVDGAGNITQVGITAGMMALPLLALLGTLALWGLLPFIVLTIAGVWFFLMRSYRSGELQEELCLWSDRVSLVRTEPSGQRQEWSANPYWVQVCEHKKPVPHYLTLRGGDREVELGAFLSPDERIALKDSLQEALARVARAPATP